MSFSKLRRATPVHKFSDAREQIMYYAERPGVPEQYALSEDLQAAADPYTYAPRHLLAAWTLRLPVAL